MAGWTTPDNENTIWEGSIRATKDLHSTGGTIQHTPTEEKDTVNKEYADNVATKSAVDLFLTENSSDIATYFDMEIDVVTAAKENIVQSITASSTTLIASFASKLAEPEIDTIALLESGVYDLHIHAEGAVAKNLFIYAEFYKRTSGGTETLLGTSHDSGELTTGEEQYSVHATISADTAWVAGDRFVCKVYGRNNSAAARNITIYMEGDTASRVEFPAIIALGNFILLTGSNIEDETSVDTAYVARVLYNTDATPPAASGFPIGTIYIQYTA